MEFALPDFKREDTLKILSDGREIKQPDMSKLIRIKVPKGKERKKMIEYLNSLPEVLYAESNGRIKPDVIPTDTRFGEQWGLRNTINTGADIHAVAAWDIYTGNSNNIIAIIDGGVETNHDDINRKITGGDTGWGWDGHGTRVSGVAAAESNNAQGISGVDWNARIHPQRIDNVSDDAGTYQAIVDAVNYSTNVRVLNNSWGLLDENEEPGRYSTTVRQAFAYAYKANRVCVAASGNHQDTLPGVISYPAGYNNMIAVGATNNSDVIAGFSGQGNHIDVCAPGVGILSTTPNDTYIARNGTSYSAPFVSGVASLLKGYNPNLANDDIEHIIQLSADKVAGMNGQDFDTIYGYGRLNAGRALEFLQAPFALRQWTASSGNVENNVGLYTMQFLGAPGLASANYFVRRYEVRKQITFPESFVGIIGVWGRGVSTNGWSMANPNFGEGFCEVVPGTLTETGVTLRTYVYEVYTTGLQYVGYYPASPANVTFAYTVLGIPMPTLSGADLICYSGTTYTIVDPPENTTITWGGTNVAYFNGNTGTTVTVRAAGSTTSNTGTITASFTIDGTPYTVSETVWVGAPKIDYISGPTYTPNYQWATYQALPNDPQMVVDDYNWILSPLNGNSVYDYGWTCDIAFYNSGYYQVVTQAHNTCGWGSYSVLGVEVYDSKSLSFLPNPTTGETTLTIEITSEEKSFDETAEWDLEVYSETQLLKTKQTNLHGQSAKIQTAGWQEGIYIVRVKYNNEILTGKLVVKK